jgi:hypothetical protein
MHFGCGVDAHTARTYLVVPGPSALMYCTTLLTLDDQTKPEEQRMKKMRLIVEGNFVWRAIVDRQHTKNNRSLNQQQISTLR